MRINLKGQVTIPREMRQKTGLLPGTEVDFEFDGRSVRIFKAKAEKAATPGASLIARMRGRGDVKMTTDEILALTRCKQGSPPRRSRRP